MYGSKEWNNWGSEDELLRLLASLMVLTAEVYRELGKNEVKLVLLAGYHVKDAQSRDTADTARERKKFQLKFDRFEAFNFARNLWVAAAN